MSDINGISCEAQPKISGTLVCAMHTHTHTQLNANTQHTNIHTAVSLCHSLLCSRFLYLSVISVIAKRMCNAFIVFVTHEYEIFGFFSLQFIFTLFLSLTLTNI